MKYLHVALPQHKKLTEENLKRILLLVHAKKSFFNLIVKKGVEFSLILALKNGEIKTFLSTEKENSWQIKNKIKKSNHFLIKKSDENFGNFKYQLIVKPKFEEFKFNISKNFLSLLADNLIEFKNKNQDVVIKIDFLTNDLRKNQKFFKRESEKIRTGKGKIKKVLNASYQNKMNDFEKEKYKVIKENAENADALYNIRITGYSDNKKILKNICSEISMSISAKNNYLKTKAIRKKQDLNDKKKLLKSNSKSFFVSVADLSKLFTLNSKNYNYNSLIDAEIPEKNYITNNDKLALGNGVFDGEEKNFYVPIEKKCLHSVIIGGTGCGKTEQMIQQFLSNISDKQEVGGLFFDISSKDASKKILARLPKDRLKDVVFLDADDVNFHFPFFGKLDNNKEKEENQISRIVGLIQELMAKFGTTLNADRYIYPLVLLAVKNNIKIKDIYKLTEKSFISNNLSKLDGINKERFSHFADGKKLHELEPALRRMDDISKNKNLRKILNEEQGVKFDIPQLMKKGKIVLISVPQDEVTKPIIQSIIVSSIKNATFSRQVGSKPFMVYLDEFSSFSNESQSVNNLLDMARKYKVGLNLAIQHISQLKASKGAVFGNVDTVFLLKSNPIDEPFLKSLFKTDIELEEWEAWVRLGNKNTSKIKMKPLEKPIRNKAEIEKLFKSYEIKEKKEEIKEKGEEGKNIINRVR